MHDYRRVANGAPCATACAATTGTAAAPSAPGTACGTISSAAAARSTAGAAVRRAATTGAASTATRRTSGDSVSGLFQLTGCRGSDETDGSNYE